MIYLLHLFTEFSFCLKYEFNLLLTFYLIIFPLINKFQKENSMWSGVCVKTIPGP